VDLEEATESENQTKLSKVLTEFERYVEQPCLHSQLRRKVS
jgi:hypothetical protein